MRHDRLALAFILVGLLGLMFFVEASAYEGRHNAVTADRTQCRRSERNRMALIHVAWAEAAANDAAAATFTPAKRAARRLVAREASSQKALAISYARQVQPRDAGHIAAALRRYATFSCTKAYPAASVWP